MLWPFLPCTTARVGVRARRACALGALILVSAAHCGPGARTARETIDRFLDAVQRQDVAELFCLLADAADPDVDDAASAHAREEFAGWFEARLAAYDQGRDEGWVDLGDDGVVAVKLLALGRGTYFELHEIRAVRPDALRARMDLRMGYQAMDLSGFSPGTTFYVCGVPPGRVHAIRKPAGRGEESVEVLDRISLEWTLVRSEPAGGCPARWTVAGVVPIEGTASSRQVTWEF